MQNTDTNTKSKKRAIYIQLSPFSKPAVFSLHFMLLCFLWCLNVVMDM